MRIVSCLVLFSILLSVGCYREQPIVEYTVSKEVPESLREKVVASETLGAIVREEDGLWFFKLSGAEAAVAPYRDAFKAWVTSVEFEKGEPKWKTPDGWTAKAGNAMRFATLVLPTEKPLEATVSRLPFRGDWENEVIENVNRWRKQVNLEASQAVMTEGEKLELAGKQDALFVDLIGEASDRPSGMGMGMPPMMAGGVGEGAQALPPKGTLPSGNSAAGGSAGGAPAGKVEYVAPEAWRPGAMNSMRLAAFEAGPEDRKAEITVIQAGGDPNSNVERWLKQIKANVTPEDLDQAMKGGESVPVGDAAGTLYRLQGDAGKATYAIIVPEPSGFHLFLKMVGDAKTVTEEEEAFKSFAKSLKLPPSG